MMQCVNAGTQGNDIILVDVLACRTCYRLWCRQCMPHLLACPECGDKNIESLTIGDDAFL